MQCSTNCATLNVVFFSQTIVAVTICGFLRIFRVRPSNNDDRHDIVEILKKVALTLNTHYP